MAIHSSVLAWRIPWMEKPGGLQSTGSQRVGHDWATSLSLSLTRRVTAQGRRLLHPQGSLPPRLSPSLWEEGKDLCGEGEWQREAEVGVQSQVPSPGNFLQPFFRSMQVCGILQE